MVGVAMRILDRIKFDGPLNNEAWIIYKVKEEGIVWGSQLVVGPGQIAIFVKGGEVLDIFSPGTYTLKSGNLPLLNRLVNLPFDNKTPFAAEIIFINTTANMALKWGTSSPVNVEDPDYGLLLGLRAFGRYGVKVSNGRLLLNQLIGTMNLDSGYNHNLINNQFTGMINTRLKSFLASFMNVNKISYLKIAEYYEDLSNSFYELISDDFDRYGIELINFYIESISPPREQFEKLRQYKEELALGEAFYTKRRSLDVLENIAGSDVGAIVATGMYSSGALNSPMEALTNNISKQSIENSKRLENSNEIVCTSCNKRNSLGSKFCSGCGEKLIKEKRCPVCSNVVCFIDRFCCSCGASLSEIKYCDKCGSEISSDSKFCSKCGSRCND